MRATIGAVVLIVCFGVFEIGAQTIPGRAWQLSQWQRRAWQIEDGLPHNYVTAIVQDKKGRLLIGTKAGVAVFDGFSFRDYAALNGKWIYSLLLTADGTLWAGTYEQGLYRVRRDRIEKIADGSFYSLTQGPDGHIWGVMPDSFGVIANGRYHAVVQGKNTDGYGWQSATRDDKGAFWFVAESGLFRLRGGDALRVPARGLEGLPVTVYFPPHSSHLLVGTTKGLYQLACGASSCRATGIENVKGPVVGVHEASDRSIWVATWGHGLYRLSGIDGQTRAENMDHRNGLTDDFVQAIYEDSEHNLWIGTRGGGLTRFRTTVLKPVGIPEGVTGNCASAVIGDNEGKVWLGTWRSGLFQWHDGVATRQKLPGGPLNNLITSLAIDSHGNLWIGSFDGLYVLRANRGPVLKVKSLPGFRANERVRQLLTTSDGRLLLIDDDGRLSVFPSGDPQTSHAGVLLPQERATYVSESHSGVLWIGTEDGLWRMTASHSSPVKVFSYHSPVLSISEDRESRLWVTHEDGSVQVEENSRLMPFSTSTFKSNLIYKVMEDNAHNFWFSTGLGLVRVPTQGIDTALADPAIHAEGVGFGIADGARTIECRCADSPQSWVAPDGTMWIPTAKGFVQADPTRLGNIPPPEASIETIRWSGSHATRSNRALLAAGAHALEVHFTAVRLSTPQQVHFRYRLQGIDQNWIDSGQDRIARYAQLPPGSYHFLVAARDPIGNWGPSAEATIDQRPYVYQTFWFKGLMMVLALIAISALYLIHLRNVRSRYAAVLAERNRIAREWHDTLLAGLAAVSLQLDTALRNCSQSGLATSLKSVRSMLRYCGDEARIAVSNLRHESLSQPDIAKMLRETLQHLTDGTGVHFDLHVADNLPRIPSEMSLHLSRICQEASSNAIRHGKASEITVGLDSTGGALLLSVRDNGCGISRSEIEASRPGHFGILGMRERVERVGGQLEISLAGGCGTVVRAKVPVVK